LLEATSSPRAPFPWLTFFAAVWLVGVLAGIAKLTLAWRESRRLCNGSTPCADSRLLAARDRLCHRMAIAPPPALALSDAIPGPMLIGIVRPAILLPAAHSTGDIDMILAHELAHLRRRDLAWGLLIAFVNVLYFFHPLVYVLRTELRRAEEAACDSDALFITGSAPHDYGRMLLSIATSQPRRFHRPAFAAGIIESAATLRTRLRLLAGAREMSRRSLQFSAFFTAVIALAGLIPWQFTPRSSAADDLPPATQLSQTPETRPSPITGQVLDADGKPATGATVWAVGVRRPSEGELVSTASVAADGSFSILPPLYIAPSALPPSPQVAMFPRGGYFAEIPGVGISQRVDMHFPSSGPLQLAPATALHVTFTTPDGAPAAGISVSPVGLELAGSQPQPQRVINFSPTLRAQWSAKTDATGACIITGLPRGARLALDVDDDRYSMLATSASAIQLADDPVTTTAITLTPSCNITGNVAFADGSKPTAPIHLVVVARGRMPAVTDASGHFELKRLQPGTYTFYLDLLPQDRMATSNPPNLSPAPDYVIKPVRVDVALGETKQANLTLISGGIITGKVRDKITGAGIPNVTIQCSPDGALEMSDKDGAYSFRVFPGAKTIRLGYADAHYENPAGPSTITAADGVTKTLNFDLSPDHSVDIRGSVTDATGKPVAGAIVYWNPPPPANANPRRVPTDAKGQFQLRAPVGTLLRARFEDQATAAPITLDGSGRPVNLQIAAENIYSLVATITDDKGAPVPNAAVSIFDGYANTIDSAQTLQSSPDGTARFDSLHSDVPSRIWVQADGFAPANRLPLPPSAPHQQQTFTVVLRATNSTIAGVVVDATGAPAANVIVGLVQSGAQSLSTKSDSQGRFKFAVPDHTTASVVIRIPEITVEGGERIYTVSPVTADSGDTNVKLVMPSKQP
jgi:beta-lactamase regulating signal transducer with metallopeptidase domain/protocatechuate 3,4-dioxygenase beta subunit